MTQGLGVNAQFYMVLANENPAIMESDDLANANQVAEMLALALAIPQMPVFLDTFTDMDRGYCPASWFGRQTVQSTHRRLISPRSSHKRLPTAPIIQAERNHIGHFCKAAGPLEEFSAKPLSGAADFRFATGGRSARCSD